MGSSERVDIDWLEDRLSQGHLTTWVHTPKILAALAELKRLRGVEAELVELRRVATTSEALQHEWEETSHLLDDDTLPDFIRKCIDSVAAGEEELKRLRVEVAEAPKAIADTWEAIRQGNKKLLARVEAGERLLKDAWELAWFHPERAAEDTWRRIDEWRAAYSAYRAAAAGDTVAGEKANG